MNMLRISLIVKKKLGDQKGCLRQSQDLLRMIKRLKLVETGRAFIKTISRLYKNYQDLNQKVKLNKYQG